MKIMSLDLGDAWVGSALSDPLGITCKPYQTVELDGLTGFLRNALTNEPISKIVIGLPTTFSGAQSAQTEKIVQQKEELEKLFAQSHPAVVWELWDERLSSKRADTMSQGKRLDKEAKRRQHSVAAAFILQSYLDRQAFTRQLTEE